ncbi:MAG: condensation domain-containing protein, partial [Pyrinomonadaceae bacterium]
MDDLLPQPTALTSEELGRLITRRRGRQAGGQGRQSIPRREPGTAAPLSFAQQRLWFLEQFDPQNTLYNMPAAIRLEGGLSIAALTHSLCEIERRHEMLRTTFVETQGEPVQMIAPSGHFQLPVLDVGGLPVEAREREVQRLGARQAQRPFNLTTGPLWRLQLLRLGPTEHVLLLVMHHIASDGWSVGKLFNELAALYGAYLAGQPSPLAELPIQYADYTRWQRETAQGDTLARQLDYWRRQLEGAPSALALPTDRPRAQRESHEGARAWLALAPELARGLQDLASAEGVTMFMALLTGFSAVLYRYSGQEDVCVGTPVANRGRAEVEGLIGFFVNTLVLRVDAAGRPSFRQLLARVREVALGAYANQDVPFEQLVREFQVDRSTHSPLFQVMFGILNMHVEG